MRPIVTQDSVVRLPRLGLLLLCLLYAVPGFFGHDPWRDNEALALERMLAPALTYTDFTTLLGQASIALFSGFIGLVNASRVPALLLLWLCFALCWYACYHFAKSEAAQPVKLPFGGQAHSVDYARTVADGSLLALMACLGLAEQGHQATGLLGQLLGISLLLYGLASSDTEPLKSPLAILSSALMCCGFGLNGLAALLFSAFLAWQSLLKPAQPNAQAADKRLTMALLIAMLICLAGLIFAPAHWSKLSQFSDAPYSLSVANIAGLITLGVWFLWPLWFIVGFGLWRLRRDLKTQLPLATNGISSDEVEAWYTWRSKVWHFLAPLLIFVMIALRTIVSADQDSALFIGIPALAITSALMLALIPRSLFAAIDWFALALFTGFALFLWLLWLAAQYGIPTAINKNIDRFYPGFREAGIWTFEALAFAAACLATIAWLALMAWRTSRARKPLWKGMVLTAGGVTLIWFLLQGLGGPMLNASRSYEKLAVSLQSAVPSAACVGLVQVGNTQRFLFHFHSTLRFTQDPNQCDYALVQKNLKAPDSAAVEALGHQWRFVKELHRPSDKDEGFALYQRVSPISPKLLSEPL